MLFKMLFFSTGRTSVRRVWTCDAIYTVSTLQNLPDFAMTMQCSKKWTINAMSSPSLQHRRPLITWWLAVVAKKKRRFFKIDWLWQKEYGKEVSLHWNISDARFPHVPHVPLEWTGTSTHFQLWRLGWKLKTSSNSTPRARTAVGCVGVCLHWKPQPAHISAKSAGPKPQSHAGLSYVRISTKNANSISAWRNPISRT